MVKAAQQQLRIAKSTPTVALQKPSVSSRDTPKVIPTPTPYVPPRVIVERIVRVPASQPLPSPQVPAVKPNTQPVVDRTPPTPPSPFEEWVRLAKLGSYGQVNTTDQPNNIASASEPANNPPPEQTPNPNPDQTPVSQAQDPRLKSLAVGSSARAVLATAVFGETTRSNGGNDADENKTVFVIKLQDPLKDKDGTPVIPANTELLAQIRSISEQGFLQMNVVKLISQNDGNVTERSLPNNAITIRGTEGKPLMASRFPGQSSSIASMDIGLFVLGGLGKAAELINRPDTKLLPLYGGTNIANTDGGGENTPPPNPNNGYITGYATVTENRRNLAAGIVEGGFNSVVPQIAQRNQQAIAQMSQPTNLWFMRAGTTVEIYVNQPI
ncbi:hypothetical protein LC605_32350, partial [Nostoc sp. CHAB 5836]|uniref:TrbI/VirB10 family protein n=1 Tax=Nostoc sp. CHAB 5836 TaxID=2780404 RepID=UPI001E3F720D